MYDNYYLTFFKETCMIESIMFLWMTVFVYYIYNPYTSSAATLYSYTSIFSSFCG